MNRRIFLKQSTRITAAAGLTGSAGAWFCSGQNTLLFKLSLAEWSLHRMLNARKLKHMDFALTAKKEFGIEAVEYVNQFFFEKAKDMAYLAEMKNRCNNEGVKSLLIMCDREGRLGDPDAERRTQAVENHYKWIEAAKYLGCHSIRVNAASEGEYDEQIRLAADGLRRLTEYGADHHINVIVENHGGLSSHGKWLAEVIKKVKHKRCGTLPDFGNFRIENGEMYDRYQGVAELMPYAKAVSAKSYDFDDNGEEISTDFWKMMKIVLDAGYRGYVGIEYEGKQLTEFEGIKKTRDLLLKIQKKWAGQFD
jgi:sugar phosphate isomerase/epimerase